MTTEHVSVPRELIEALVKQWKQECMTFADMPAGIPVPKRLYLWNRVADLEDILSRATPSDDCACPQGQICKTMSCKRLQKPPLNFHRLYEELRAAIDCGNESMTHEDALEWIRSASTPSVPRVVTDMEEVLVSLSDDAAYLRMENDGDSEIADNMERAAEIIESFATSLPAARVPDAEVRLWDTQWMNIVNHDNCYRDWSKDDAIAHAVKMTEQAIARNVADGKLPPKKIAAATQAGETK